MTSYRQWLFHLKVDADNNLNLTLARFHKEELAGETRNYVHIRAYIEDKTPLEVLAEIAEELRISRNTIHKVLSLNPKALQAWTVYERGYM